MSEPTGTQYGGFWIRFLALLADSAIVFLISAALLTGAAMALAPQDMTVAVIAVGVLGFLYWPILHASRLRASFGKALLGLHVTRFDGRRISILRALWREIAKIFSSAVSATSSPLSPRASRRCTTSWRQRMWRGKACRAYSLRCS